MATRYKVSYLPLADADIERIAKALVDYPNKASRLIKEMDENLLKLEDMPYMWPVFHTNPKYRKMVLEDHLLFYIVDEQMHEVKVCRVLYEKMNISSHLR